MTFDEARRGLEEALEVADLSKPYDRAAGEAGKAFQRVLEERRKELGASNSSCCWMLDVPFGEIYKPGGIAEVLERHYRPFRFADRWFRTLEELESSLKEDSRHWIDLLYGGSDDLYLRRGWLHKYDLLSVLVEQMTQEDLDRLAPIPDGKVFYRVMGAPSKHILGGGTTLTGYWTSSLQQATDIMDMAVDSCNEGHWLAPDLRIETRKRESLTFSQRMALANKRNHCESIDKNEVFVVAVAEV